MELVGKDCPEKNDWYREAAAGEYEKLQAELDRDTEQFHQTVRENRPLVTADMLTGKVFEAQEVMPALVDEIGDMNRAIECICELANETLTAARLVTAEPKNEPDGEQPEGEEPEEMSKLNAQQKAAVATSRGDLRIVDDGHVKKEEQGFFGPETVEIAKPQNQEDMTDEEKKAAEVAEQPAATQEQTPATEQPAEGAAATEAPAVSKENAQEEQPAAQEGAPAAEPAAEPASQEAQENAAAEIDKITETLHMAEQKIAEKDQEIAQLKETLATLNGIAEERDAAIQERNDISASLEKAGLDYAEQGKALTAAEAKIAEHVATIEKLNKQVKELQSEVKELSEKPAPMVDAGAGIPQDNGTGEAPKKQERITSDMSYEEIQEFEKRKREKK